MHMAVSYTPYATSSREKTGDTITFAQFEEEDLLSETRNLLGQTHDNMESGTKYGDNSTMPPLICEEEMDKM